MNWHRIDQSLDAGEDGDEGEAPSGDIKASGAIAGETIPMGIVRNFVRGWA